MEDGARSERQTHADAVETYRSRSARVLAAAIWVVAAVSMVALVLSDGARAIWQAGPFLVLAAGACWALFWNPRVTVHAAGVRVVNVFRTIELPWPAILDVDTKWALTFTTAYGRFTAWAAPAPGMRHALRATREEAPHLPMRSLSGVGMRPGDLPTSASGDAALLVRARWNRLREAGHLDDPRLEHDRAPVTWHWLVIGAGTALLVACVVVLTV